MRQLLRRFWQDDCGAIISVEYVFFMTILVIGTIVGMTNMRDAINVELTESANALLAVSQGFTISGSSGGSGGTDGSQAIDTAGTSSDMMPVPPSMPSVIDVSLPGS